MSALRPLRPAAPRRLQPGARIDREPCRHRDRRQRDAPPVRALLHRARPASEPCRARRTPRHDATTSETWRIMAVPHVDVRRRSQHHSSAPTTQTYYDRFSATYEAERHHGYHRLIDELELQLIRKYGGGRDVFEAGCGTGLLLREAARVARSAVGLDLSRGMLGAAHGRGLRVVQGSLTDVPLPVGVGRPGLQHEGAGPRPAHRARAGRAGAPGAAGGPPPAGVLQPVLAALPGQARWAGRRPSPPTPPITTSSPATTPPPRRARTCRPSWRWSACAACAC